MKEQFSILKLELNISHWSLGTGQSSDTGKSLGTGQSLNTFIADPFAKGSEYFYNCQKQQRIRTRGYSIHVSDTALVRSQSFCSERVRLFPTFVAINPDHL